MAAIFANYRGYQIGDKVDGTVLQQIETGLKYSLVICEYKYYMILRLLGDKEPNKTENMAEIPGEGRGGGEGGGGVSGTLPYIRTK